MGNNNRSQPTVTDEVAGGEVDAAEQAQGVVGGQRAEGLLVVAAVRGLEKQNEGIWHDFREMF